MKITWYGTASLSLQSGQSTLWIDPFYPLKHSRVHIPKNAFADCREILISHGHFDHIGSLGSIANAQTTVYCTAVPYASLLGMGLSKAQLCQIHPNSKLQIGAFQVQVLQGKHGRAGVALVCKSLFRKQTFVYRRELLTLIRESFKYKEKKETVCYQISAEEKTIFVMGSLALQKQYVYSKGMDLLVLPYQGTANTLRSSEEIVERLHPKAVLLSHFDDTFPPISSTVNTVPFEQRMKEKITVYRVKQGGSIEL